MKPAWIGWSLRRAGARLLRRLGWGRIWLAALGLILAAVWAAQYQLRATLRAEKRAASVAASQPRTAATWPAPVLNWEQDLAAFEARLPPADEAMQILSDLFALAAKQQLALARGDYRMQWDDAGGFMRFRLTLPVKGEAKVIQRFAQDAMLAYPSLAFESITFKRERVDAQAVEARIQWTLLMRPAGRVKPAAAAAVVPMAPASASPAPSS